MTKHQAPEVTSELRECPKCRADVAKLSVTRAGTNEWWEVECDGDTEEGCGLLLGRQTKRAVITAWNTRATQPQSLTIDEGLIARLRDCANGIGSFKTDRGDFGLCDDAADRLQSLSGEQIAENANCSGDAPKHGEVG